MKRNLILFETESKDIDSDGVLSFWALIMSTSFIFQAIQGAYGEPAFEELDEIFYIVKPNTYHLSNSFRLFNIVKDNKVFKNQV